MSGIIRVLVPIDSQTDLAFDLALSYAEQICKKTGATDIVLLTHTKHQLEHTALARRLGGPTVKALSKGSVNTGSGYKLRTETMRTLTYLAQKSVLIVYYAEGRILDHADGLHNLVGVALGLEHSRPGAPGAGRVDKGSGDGYGTR